MNDDSEAFVAIFREFAGDALRDVWTFDADGERCLYIREDVADSLDGHDPEQYIDNERYGYITRRTYNDLTYAEYQYTVRGFDEFSTFRTFIEDVGVLASVDRGKTHDFGELFDRLQTSEIEYDSIRGSDEPNDSHVTADD
ncbi:DUF7522 family protein [Halorarius litoreus]|uniref:DUF7522 family protein n=1 Tax=Halorarius litoreus TaxID=2962676 RepID=UPI0020CCC5CD|nr:hypothetical protein [Halorarius litoreus]